MCQGYPEYYPCEQFCPPITPQPALTVPSPLAPTASIGVYSGYYALPDHVHALPLITDPFTPTPGPIAVGDTMQTAISKLVAGTAVPSDADPLALGPAAPGASLLYSREDHVHPLPLLVEPYTPAPGVVVAGDTVQEAIQKIDGNTTPPAATTENFTVDSAGGAPQPEVITGTVLVDGQNVTITIDATISNFSGDATDLIIQNPTFLPFAASGLALLQGTLVVNAVAQSVFLRQISPATAFTVFDAATFTPVVSSGLGIPSTSTLLVTGTYIGT